MVTPKSNAAPEMQPWVRWVQEEITALSRNQGIQETNIKAAFNNASAASTGAQNAATTANKAETAANAASQVATSALRKPGDQLFDRSAIEQQNITLWDVVRLEEYTWITNGISATIPAGATSQSGNMIKVWNKNTIPFAPGSGGKMRIDFDWSLAEGAGQGIEDHDSVWLLTDWRDANGNVIMGSGSAYGAWGNEGSGHHYADNVAIPPTAVSLRLGWEMSRKAAATTPTTGTISNPSVVITVPSESIKWDGTVVPGDSLPSFAQSPGVGSNYFDVLPFSNDAALGRTDRQRLEQDFVVEGLQSTDTVNIGPGGLSFTYGLGTADRIVLNKELIRIDPGDTLATASTFTHGVNGTTGSTATINIGVVYDWYDANQSYVSRTVVRSVNLTSTTTIANSVLGDSYARSAPTNARYVRVGHLIGTVTLPSNAGTLTVGIVNPRQYLAVTSKMIGQGAVGTNALADNSVTMAKLGSDVSLTPADNSIGTAKLVDGSVTLPKQASAGHFELTAVSSPASAQVLPVGTFSYDSAASNDPSLVSTGASGIFTLNQPGVYSIRTIQSNATYGMGNRSFVDIDAFISGAWMNQGRWAIPTGEDRVAASLPNLRIGSATQLRFNVYRQPTTGGTNFSTRVIVTRIGKF